MWVVITVNDKQKEVGLWSTMQTMMTIILYFSNDF
jgi:hypothetical protein